MAKRKDIEATSPDGAPVQTSIKSELPTVESPSISPATPETTAEPMPMIGPIAAAPKISSVTEMAAAPEGTPAATPSRFVLRPRQKRYALLAATIAVAAAFGAIVGAVVGGGLSSSQPRTDVAGLEERKAMRQTLSQLNKEVTTLKSSLEAANKSAHSQIAKISERFDRTAGVELITGSISAPQTTAPLPTPRPSPRVAAVETQSSARPQVVQGWEIRDARDGFVYVQTNGDVYQVVLGAPLPGLGPVASVKRQDGRWVVTTPKGIIVSMRDRRYFE
jgi:hypothetical protein